MCYLLNAFSCTNWHIWKKLRKYIFMFTWLKVVPTIKIGTHMGPLCHVKNVTFWKFSWYCEKTRWKALYFYMINMICMMCVFIWIFTQLYFYLIDDSYVGQKYGIEFSCQFRCRNMSRETIKWSCHTPPRGPTARRINPICSILPLNGRMCSNVSKWFLKCCNLVCYLPKICIFFIKQAISPWVPNWLFVKMTSQPQIIDCNHGYFVMIVKIGYENIASVSNLWYTYETNANSNINLYVHRPSINLNPR